MLDRSQLIGMVGSLDDATILKMLSAVGVTTGDRDGANINEQLALQPDDKIPSWNEEKVAVAQTTRPPILNKDFLKQLEVEPGQSVGLRPALPTGNEQDVNNPREMPLDAIKASTASNY